MRSLSLRPISSLFSPARSTGSNRTRRLTAYVVAGLGLTALFSDRAGAQCISLSTSGSAYTQNFDTLANTGSSATVPAGWAILESLANANTSYTAGTGSLNTGDTYSFGAAASTDRALGTLQSGTLLSTIGACFTNNTGAPITSLAIAYSGEEWRLGAPSRPDHLDFQYSLNATSLSTGSWADVAALSFNTPDTTGTAGARDGNSAGFRTAVSSTISSLSIANGATFWIRWNDFNAAGADDGLAVDDFSLTPTASAAPTNPTGLGAANPSTVQAGNSTLLTLAVTPGANPASTGLTVTVDLSAIGGSATQQFFNDGTHGDVNSADATFSFQATVPSDNSTGLKSLPFTVADGQSRSGSGSIAITVTPLSTSPTGSGSANPNSLQSGASTLLTVNVTGGSNPASTGLTVTGDLSAIGGSASQQFVDNGGNSFSFQATVLSGTAPGLKSLPVTIADAQLRTGSTSIALTVQSPPAPTTVKISQVYGGGGNSGSTYTRDFIEIFNQASTSLDISLWSVQTTSATGTTWNVTNLCPANGSCSIQPGHYYLVHEAQGAGGTTSLPAADMTGSINMGAPSGKIALVNSTTALSGACPTGGGIADFVGYGGAGTNCSETTPTASLDNLTAAVRKGNGCVDTDNNSNDFVLIGPIPRNSGSAANTCGGNPALLSGVGAAVPSSVDPEASVLLKVTVTPAASPASTGLAVIGNLTSIGGSASQPFYDDGSSQGDEIAGDNVFSFRAAAPLTTGAKNIPATITDAQGRSASSPITITVQSPTCGVERWSVKTGTDADAGLVNLNSAVRTTIAALRGIPPPGTIPLDHRVAPTETTMYVINGTLTLYKLESDADYHIVVQDSAGNTIITESPNPGCDGTISPFDSAISAVRAKLNARLAATPNFQNANLPVQMKGIGFFDFIHGQTGVAPNGIELHPLLDVAFTTPGTTVLSSNLNPAVYGQAVTITATVSDGGPTPTGNVTFFEGATFLGTSALDANGRATYTTNTLSAGTHLFTASYEGDSQAAESMSAQFSQVVNQATPGITWPQPASITYGSALGAGQLNATSPVAGAFVYTPPLGTVLPVGNGQTLSVTLTPSSNNYTSASKSVSIDVLPASGGGTPANLVLTRTLARVNGQVVATIAIANNGGTAADNVTLSTAKIGTVSGTPLPQSLGTIAAGSSVQTTVTFPGTVGAPGASSSLTLSGTYTGATFGSTLRVTLP